VALSHLHETESQASLDRPMAYLNRPNPADMPVNRVRGSTSGDRALALTDPAILVVTDFAREHPVTITEDRPIEEALQTMIVGGVRALLVVHDDVVLGLITSYDIQGERTLQFLRSSSSKRHDPIKVGHIMTPWAQVPTLDWPAVCAERIAGMVKFFKDTHATHGVILEYLDQGGIFVRALISRAQLERQLGRSIYR
jgi:CBS domain